MDTARKGIPPALWALTISAFGIGTTEFVIVGLLPTIARDLHTSIPFAGYLVTLYALGVAVGGPILTALTGKMGRKQVLLYAIALFTAGNLGAILAPDFITLAIARVLTGFSHGVFFGIGATVAGSLVTPSRKATAIAIMFAGLTVATVLGIPIGTYIGQHFGWRMTFTGITVWGLVSLIANKYLLPGDIPNGPLLKLKEQARVLQHGSVLLVLFITIFGFTGVFAAFTYIATLLQSVTGFSENAISIILLIYGVGVAIGNIVGGKAADKNPVSALMVIFSALSVTMLVLYLVIPFQVAAVAVLFIMGFLFFANVPGLQSYIVQLSEKHLPGTENIASSLNISAFNIGIAAGSSLGGFIINHQIGIRATLWVGSIVVLIAFLLCIVSWKKEHKTLKIDLKWNTEN